jgi:DNA invertase Pin-like site-specific DNA recombinase
MNKQKTTAIYCRVSKSDESQNPENQLVPLRKFAETLNYKVVREYVDYASGGNSNRPQFQQMLKDAQQHKFEVILIWALDRFSREGILNTLGYLKTLRQANVGLKSLQESWVDTTDLGMGELLIAILSWVADQERKRIIERTKAGLERAKANGKVLGRPKGAKDTKRRKRSGYLLRWQNKRVSI